LGRPDPPRPAPHAPRRRQPHVRRDGTQRLDLLRSPPRRHAGEDRPPLRRHGRRREEVERALDRPPPGRPAPGDFRAVSTLAWLAVVRALHALWYGLRPVVRSLRSLFL